MVALLYEPIAHAAQVGLATSLETIYLPAADVTWNVGVFHELPPYATVLDVIPLQFAGVVDGVGAVKRHFVFALNGDSEVNVPLLYPLGYPSVLHAVQLLAPALLKFGDAHAPHVLPVPTQSLDVGVAVLPPPLLKYPAVI